MLSLSIPPGPLRVLCVGAHPDDIEIGCGGTLLALAESRSLDVTALLLTGTDDRVAESTAALAALTGADDVAVHVAALPDGRLPAHWGAAKDFLERHRGQVAPDVIFAPRREDAHQDHAVTAELVMTVWRDSFVLRYEIPKWDGDFGVMDTYVPLADDIAQRKVKLLNIHFGSQHSRDWWDDEMFLGVLRLRGMECRTRYAEGFVTDKTVLALRGEGTQS